MPPHKFTPEDRAAARAARAANDRAKREAAEQAAEQAGVGTAHDAALTREARRQFLQEQALRGGRLDRTRYSDIRQGLEAAGFKTVFDLADFTTVRGEHQSGSKYIETDYLIILDNGNGEVRQVFGSIRFYGASRTELRAAIFAKEGADIDSGEVEAVITGDVDLPE